MKKWQYPVNPSGIYMKGDMPGDKINIGQSHIKRSETIVPYLQDWLDNNQAEKIVISVYGGSGVGKSEIGSLLSYYLRECGYPTYLLSGDNYPYRIPEDNDKERLRIFRYGVLKNLSESNSFTEDKMKQLQNIWDNSDNFKDKNDDWDKYVNCGINSLKSYLGTEKEIDFPLINKIIKQFKESVKTIPLKRMGRDFNSISMEPVDFSSTRVLIVEWTHGNNPLLSGIDYPIFLYSTPAETLTHRLSRARDKGVDSPFVSMVLKIEQEILEKQLNDASLVVSLSAEILNKG